MIDLTNEELGYSLLSVSIIGNQPYTFPTLINTYNLELTFESTNPAVATVNTDGEVSIVGNGTTTINAIFAGNEEYNAKTISYVLTINVKKYLDYEGLKAFKQEIDKIIEDNEKITSAALNVLNKQTIKLNNTIEENEEVTSTALNDLHDRVDDIMGSYQSDWNQDDNTNPSYIKNKPTLGTASEKDVPTSGNASSTQVVLGNDSRLSDSRPASDVSEWAKQSTKPSYTKSEIGLGNVTNDSQVKRSEIGVANGVAELDSNGKVPSSQLPSFVDDIIEGYLYNDHFYLEATHINLVTDETGASTDRLIGKIYLDVSTDKTYRWSGSAYTQIKGDITLGETSSTAYRGDRGKIAYDHSQSVHARTDATKVESSSTNGNIKINDTETTVYTHPGSGTNPHGTTKNDVGLGNVGNFKAVSTVALLGLSSTEQSNARANIGAGTGTVTGVTIGTEPYTPTSGVVTIPAYPTTLPASDVSAWAKAATKPTYTLAEIGVSMSVMAINTNTSSVCGITGTGNSGKTETIIYTNSGSSDLTVTVPTTYATPDGEAIELTCVSGGYCEVNYLNVGGTIYARGL